MECSPAPSFPANQRIQSDIGLSRRPDVPDLKTAGLETILHQPAFLRADHGLYSVRDDEAGGRRPDVARMAKGEVAALMDMAARNQPHVVRAEHLYEPGAHRLRNVADRGAGFLGIIRGHQK